MIELTKDFILCVPKGETIQPSKDVNRHKSTGTNSCNHLVPECLTALVPCKRTAFTLAEILITLAVIGIVAALTLPGLIQNHNEKAWSTAKDLWEKKLTETVRRMNTDGVMTGHKTTEDFMNSFKNYLKVIKTCDNNDINKCYSPRIVLTGSDSEPIEVETSELKTAKNFGNSEWGTNTVSFVVADGTTVIMIYNPKCPYADPIEDTGSQVSCLGFMVDVNGKKGPNKVGDDIALKGPISLSKCDNPIGDMCFSAVFAATRVINTCVGNEYEDIEKYHGVHCNENYWAGAKLTCQEMGMSLPTMSQLAQLANELYVDKNNNAITIGVNEDISNIKIKDEYNKEPPITFGQYDYWSNDEYGANSVYIRYFRDDSTAGSKLHWNGKDYSIGLAVCIGD